MGRRGDGTNGIQGKLDVVNGGGGGGAGGSIFISSSVSGSGTNCYAGKGDVRRMFTIIRYGGDGSVWPNSYS